MSASRRWSDNSLGKSTSWTPQSTTTGDVRTIASTLGKTPEAPFMCRPSTGSGLSKRYTGIVQG